MKHVRDVMTNKSQKGGGGERGQSKRARKVELIEKSSYLVYGMKFAFLACTTDIAHREDIASSCPAQLSCLVRIRR